MTPAKLKRKTKNKLLAYAKGMKAILDLDPPIQNHTYTNLDQLHDFAMRAYAEGYTHGEAAERESHSRVQEG